MATLTWVGGGNNRASNPADWSPSQAPQAGDQLLMSGGTMNVTGNALAGDTVTLTPSSPHATFNLSGKVSMDIARGYPGGGTTTVNLVDHSEWNGGFSNNYTNGEFLIQADGEHGRVGRFANTSSTVGNDSTIIDADVTGAGTFTLQPGGNEPKLEFMHSVSNNQTVNVLGGGRYGTPSLLQIDDPKDYHATTVLGYGQITLEDITATSYDLKHDMLRLFDGNKMVDDLSAATTGIAQQDFGVSQVGGSVVIHSNGSYYSDGGSLLPMHG